MFLSHISFLYARKASIKPGIHNQSLKKGKTVIISRNNLTRNIGINKSRMDEIPTCNLSDNLK